MSLYSGYYIQDNETGKQESLRTKDAATAKRLWHARNEAQRLPAINLQIARAYVVAADPKMAARNWEDVMSAIASLKQGKTQRRWLVAIKDNAFDLVRNKPLLETTSQDLLKVMAAGTVSTNVYLRRIHNFALDMDWLLRSIIPQKQWPKIVHASKRAITFEEHQRIIEAEAAAARRNQGSRNSDEPHYNERLLFYKLCWHLGGIRSDLAFLGKHDKRLVVQIQTKAFAPGQNCCPAYLSGTNYGGGVYRTRWGSFNPLIWDARVNRRLNALYEQLGKAFDREPYLEAVVVPETAVTGDVAVQGEVRYTVEKYTRSVEEGMQTLKEAFPHTVVIQYANMPLESIPPLAEYAKVHGIGFGGPDIYPFDPVLTNPQRGVYRFYATLSGIVPLGAAVQQNDYTQKGAFRGPPGETPVKEIYEFGRDKLRLNYIFWGVRRGYFEKVQAMLAEPTFPKDPAGGLDSKCPQALVPPSSGEK